MTMGPCPEGLVLLDHDLSVELDTEPRSAARARHALSHLLSERGVEGETKDFALLVVSELVTNAILYGREPIEFRAALTDDIIRIEVSDGEKKSRGAAANYADPRSTSGRGLAVVEAVSRDWGVRRGDAGKTIWATLDT
jgi:anti-sigma regulatory factor (Ser/Thr protein kinase)